MTISTAYADGLSAATRAWPITLATEVRSPYPSGTPLDDEFVEGFEFAAKVLTITSLMRVDEKVAPAAPPRMTKNGLSEWQRVRKKESYGFPGVIVSIFYTVAGKERIVVDCRAGGVEDMLHIFNADQFEADPEHPF